MIWKRANLNVMHLSLICLILDHRCSSANMTYLYYKKLRNPIDTELLFSLVFRFSSFLLLCSRPGAIIWTEGFYRTNNDCFKLTLPRTSSLGV